jgi:hypothetical protein
MDFTMGRDLKILKMTVWAAKSTNIVLEYTKRCGIATFGGFSEKSSFYLYFHQQIMIINF